MIIEIGKSKNLTLISGPCSIESEEMSLFIAEYICEITKDLPISYIFRHPLIKPIDHLLIQTEVLVLRKD